MEKMEQFIVKQSEYNLTNNSGKKSEEPGSEKYQLRLKKIKELTELNLAYLRRIHPDYEVAKRA